MSIRYCSAMYPRMSESSLALPIFSLFIISHVGVWQANNIKNMSWKGFRIEVFLDPRRVTQNFQDYICVWLLQPSN